MYRITKIKSICSIKIIEMQESCIACWASTLYFIFRGKWVSTWVRQKKLICTKGKSPIRTCSACLTLRWLSAKIDGWRVSIGIKNDEFIKKLSYFEVKKQFETFKFGSIFMSKIGKLWLSHIRGLQTSFWSRKLDFCSWFYG